MQCSSWRGKIKSTKPFIRFFRLFLYYSPDNLDKPGWPPLAGWGRGEENTLLLQACRKRMRRHRKWRYRRRPRRHRKWRHPKTFKMIPDSFVFILSLVIGMFVFGLPPARDFLQNFWELVPPQKNVGARIVVQFFLALHRARQYQGKAPHW